MSQWSGAGVVGGRRLRLWGGRGRGGMREWVERVALGGLLHVPYGRIASVYCQYVFVRDREFVHAVLLPS